MEIVYSINFNLANKKQCSKMAESVLSLRIAPTSKKQDKAALVLNLRNDRSQPKADMTILHMGGFGPSLWSRTNLAAGIEADIQFA